MELARTGQWSASTGVSTITRDDLTAAVAAMGCPAVREPVIKLGHTDPRFDGQPAIGRVTNLAVVNAGKWWCCVACSKSSPASADKMTRHPEPNTSSMRTCCPSATVSSG